MGYANVSTGRHGKLIMAYTLKFTLMYKIAIQLPILCLQGVQIFPIKKCENDLRRTLRPYYKHLKLALIFISVMLLQSIV